MKNRSFCMTIVMVALAAGSIATVQADSYDNEGTGKYRHGGILNKGGFAGTGFGEDRRKDYYDTKPGLVDRTVETVTNSDNSVSRHERRKNKRDKTDYSEDNIYTRDNKRLFDKNGERKIKGNWFNRNNKAAN